MEVIPLVPTPTPGTSTTTIQENTNASATHHHHHNAAASVPLHSHQFRHNDEAHSNRVKTNKIHVIKRSRASSLGRLFSNAGTRRCCLAKFLRFKSNYNDYNLIQQFENSTQISSDDDDDVYNNNNYTNNNVVDFDDDNNDLIENSKNDCSCCFCFCCCCHLIKKIFTICFK